MNDPHSSTSAADMAAEKTRMEEIEEFCGKYDVSFVDAKVKDLRHIVPLMLMEAYSKEYGLYSRKVKGIWEKKPANWPSHVPFVDPNNKIKSVNGENARETNSKPTKQTCLEMLGYLRGMLLDQGKVKLSAAAEAAQARDRVDRPTLDTKPRRLAETVELGEKSHRAAGTVKYEANEEEEDETAQAVDSIEFLYEDGFNLFRFMDDETTNDMAKLEIMSPAAADDCGKMVDLKVGEGNFGMCDSLLEQRPQQGPHCPDQEQLLLQTQQQEIYLLQQQQLKQQQMAELQQEKSQLNTGMQQAIYNFGQKFVPVSSNGDCENLLSTELMLEQLQEVLRLGEMQQGVEQQLKQQGNEGVLHPQTLKQDVYFTIENKPMSLADQTVTTMPCEASCSTVVTAATEDVSPKLIYSSNASSGSYSNVSGSYMSSQGSTQIQACPASNHFINTNLDFTDEMQPTYEHIDNTVMLGQGFPTQTPTTAVTNIDEMAEKSFPTYNQEKALVATSSGQQAIDDDQPTENVIDLISETENNVEHLINLKDTLKPEEQKRLERLIELIGRLGPVVETQSRTRQLSTDNCLQNQADSECAMEESQSDGYSNPIPVHPFRQSSNNDASQIYGGIPLSTTFSSGTYQASLSHSYESDSSNLQASTSEGNLTSLKARKLSTGQEKQTPGQVGVMGIKLKGVKADLSGALQVVDVPNKSLVVSREPDLEWSKVPKEKQEAQMTATKSDEQIRAIGDERNEALVVLKEDDQNGKESRIESGSSLEEFSGKDSGFGCSYESGELERSSSVVSYQQDDNIDLGANLGVTSQGGSMDSRSTSDSVLASSAVTCPYYFSSASATHEDMSVEEMKSGSDPLPSSSITTLAPASLAVFPYSSAAGKETASMMNVGMLGREASTAVDGRHRPPGHNSGYSENIDQFKSSPQSSVTSGVTRFISNRNEFTSGRNDMQNLFTVHNNHGAAGSQMWLKPSTGYSANHVLKGSPAYTINSISSWQQNAQMSSAQTQSNVTPGVRVMFVRQPSARGVGDNGRVSIAGGNNRLGDSRMLVADPSGMVGNVGNNMAGTGGRFLPSTSLESRGLESMVPLTVREVATTVRNPGFRGCRVGEKRPYLPCTLEDGQKEATSTPSTQITVGPIPSFIENFDIDDFDNQKIKKSKN